MTSNESPWFLRPLADNSAARVFCMPYSGTGASMYGAWPERLGQIEIVPIQLPGRENRSREPHFGTYENLSGQLVEALLPYLDRPYAFFGHCAGVLPGFDATVRLIDQGHPAPTHLFVSSQVAPHEKPYGRFLKMSSAELADVLRTLMRATGGAEPDPEMVELYLEVLIADTDAHRNYQIAEPIQLPCGITVFGWDNDTEVDSNLLGGWEAYGQTRFQLLEGDHYTFLSGPDALLNEIRQDMENAL